AKIEIAKNTVDMTKAGTYEVTYKVTDSEGASTTKTITVTVNPKMEKLNEVPTIQAEDKTLTVGDTFDPKKDVTATDKEDGDLTAKIEIAKNTVDMTKAGTYEVTYKVTDSEGASTTKTITVTVNPKMEKLNEVPTIQAEDKTL
ncbi:immunoglobulin-like domain-containing protein, partial [[Clostridium] innocuum]